MSFRTSKPPDRVSTPFRRPQSNTVADIPVARVPSPAPIPIKPSSSKQTPVAKESPSTIISGLLSGSPMTSDKGESLGMQPCEICELSGEQTWNCSYCDMIFCDGCWAKQGPHRPGRTGPDGLPHEKADLRIVSRYKEILTPATDTDGQRRLHLEDEDTTWFGISRDLNNQPVLRDHGRYAAIIADSSTGEYKIRYPQLVSFIGQTGAGKSTLVKMLIDQQERVARSYHAATFPSPVVGSTRNDNIPTSGDVHLYGDPKSYLGQYPVLYADCEGLEGGENMPISAQFCNPSSQPRKRSESHGEHKKHQKISKSGRGSQRDIKWANSSETRKRQYAVTELYPRLLYTFSDVIVFVLRNPK
jgi:energy-coupling factor transporter ATP-binding protein EcfA2